MQPIFCHEKEELLIDFLNISSRDYLKTEGKLTIARKIWIRMAFIFAGVGIGLYLVHTFSDSLTVWPTV
jgi:hypothetical protein